MSCRTSCWAASLAWLGGSTGEEQAPVLVMQGFAACSPPTFGSLFV